MENDAAIQETTQEVVKSDEQLIDEKLKAGITIIDGKLKLAGEFAEAVIEAVHEKMTKDGHLQKKG